MTKECLTIICIILSITAVSCVQTQQTIKQPVVVEEKTEYTGPAITVAILNFENNSVTDIEKVEPLTKGLASMLATDLARIKSLQIVERAKILAIVYLVLAALTLFSFGLGSEGSATFVVSRPDDAIQVGDITVSAAGLAFVVAAILAFLGARQWMRGFGSKTNLILAIGLGLFALSSSPGPRREPRSGFPPGIAA